MTLAIPYRTFADTTQRPYLVMLVTGINGRQGHVVGLLDSGADSTMFPFTFATLMGYTQRTLAPTEFGQADGSRGSALLATQPCTAIVPEIPTVTVEMTPTFVRGAELTLWGRTDVMKYFDVTIRQADEQFTLEPRAAPST